MGALDLRPCPLCGGRSLKPVFDPPLVRCQGCGLVFRNQESAPESVRGQFETLYEDSQREQHVRERRVSVYRDFLKRHRPLPGRNRLLDVGCGSGEFLRLARECGWDVTGVEIAEAAAQTARLAGLPVHVGPLGRADLPEASFDVITLWNVLDFLPDPVELAALAKRLLAPGGLFTVRVGNLAFQSAVYRVSHLFRRWPRLVAPIARQRTFHQVAFNARTLRRTLERSGFDRIEITNSRLSRGDPYRTLRRGDDPTLQSVKWSLYVLAGLVAACTGGRVLWGSSLLATAVKEGDPR